MHLRLGNLEYIFNFSTIQHAKSVDERNLLFCQEMNTEVLEFDPSSRFVVWAKKKYAGFRFPDPT
jgi:hypothetical protein